MLNRMIEEQFQEVGSRMVIPPKSGMVSAINFHDWVIIEGYEEFVFEDMLVKFNISNGTAYLYSPDSKKLVSVDIMDFFLAYIKSVGGGSASAEVRLKNFLEVDISTNSGLKSYQRRVLELDVFFSISGWGDWKVANSMEKLIIKLPLGLRIRVIRSLKSISQKDLAQKIGRSVNSLESIERGKGAKLLLYKKIADALDITFEELTEGLQVSEG